MSNQSFFEQSYQLASQYPDDTARIVAQFAQDSQFQLIRETASQAANYHDHVFRYVHDREVLIVETMQSPAGFKVAVTDFKNMKKFLITRTDADVTPLTLCDIDRAIDPVALYKEYGIRL